MIVFKYSQLALVLLALVVARQLEGQDEVPAPEPEPEEVGTTPASALIPGGPGELRPDVGIPTPGNPITFPEFGIGRHFRISASLNGGYDDNVNLTPTGSPSWYANPTANLRYQFGSARLAMDVLGGGGINYYFDHPGGRDYDPMIFLQFSLAYKVTPRLTIDLTSSSVYEAQPEFGTALSSTRRLGNYLRSENLLSAHYQLSHRLSSITGFSLDALEYENSAASGHDRMQYAFSEQLRYLLMPATTVSGTYRVSFNESGGAQSNSTTQSLIGGLEQTFSPRLRASLHSGVQFRSGNNGLRISPYVETSVEYELESLAARASRGVGTNTTYIVWTNRYSIEESDQQRAAGRETFRTSLRANIAMTARISASLDLSYSNGDNNQSSSRSVGGSSTENTFDITPAVRYAITQRCTANVGYRHTEVDRGSGVAALNPLQSLNSYTRNRYFAGITITF